MRIILTFASAFIISYVLTPVFEVVARRLNMVDYPGSEKDHNEPTPFLGGIAMYISFMLVAVFALKGLGQPYKFLFIAATIVFILGFIDDIKPLSPLLRLLVQFLAAAIAVQGGIYFSFLSNTVWGRIAEITLSLIWLVGVTNAFNCLDGLNGLLAGVAVINTVTFFIFAMLTGQYLIALVLLALCGSCAGFFPHNFFRGKIFMGNAGSAWVGFMLAGLAIIGDWAENNPVDLIVPILIFGVPIFDMATTTIARIYNKKVKNITELLEYKCKDHFHYRLSQIGLGNKGAVLFIFLMCVLLGLSGLLLYLAPNPAGVAIVLFMCVIYFMLISLLIVASLRKN